MADAFWMQLGANPTFALEVAGRIVGLTYWLDVHGFPVEAADESLRESGWYWLSVNRPRYPERVAQGLELSPEMAEDQLSDTVQRALEAVANEVLADGGEE